jgi:hypothetical protein
MVFNATFNNTSVIVVVSSKGGGNRSTRRKPTTCRKLLTNFITQCCIEYTSPERDSNSQRRFTLKTNAIDQWSRHRSMNFSNRNLYP